MTLLGRLTASIALFLLLWQGVRGARAFWGERQAFHPRLGAVPRPVDAQALGLVDVSFRSRDGAQLHGWYVPSRNGAAVVLCHGSGSDRRAMLEEARALSGSGPGLLLFDLPGHGESERIDVRYGDRERAGLLGAIDYLATRPDVDSTRLGAVGASMGSYLLAQVASRDTRLRAVVLEGAFGDAVEQTRVEYARSGIVPTWGALLAMRAAGMEPDEDRPLDVIAAISPRALVIVAGTEDETVPAALSRRLFEAAREPKEFWLIPDARHGDYSKADNTFAPRLREFFRRTLGPASDSTGTTTGPSVDRTLTVAPP